MSQSVRRALPEPHQSLFLSLCNAAIHASRLAVYTVVLNLVHNNTQGLTSECMGVNVCVDLICICMCLKVCVRL